MHNESLTVPLGSPVMRAWELLERINGSTLRSECGGLAARLCPQVDMPRFGTEVALRLAGGELGEPSSPVQMERMKAEGMSKRDAPSCLKRLIARAVFKAIVHTEQAVAAPVVRVKFGADPVAVCSVD